MFSLKTMIIEGLVVIAVLCTVFAMGVAVGYDKGITSYLTRHSIVRLGD